MKITTIAFATTVAIDAASAFVAAPTQSSSCKNVSPLSAVDGAMTMAMDPTYVIAGVGAAVSAIGGAAIAFGRRGGKSDAPAIAQPELEPEPIDVSIPYDAAASLAFSTYTESSSAKVDFKQFQTLYYEQMVAEVKAKVQERRVNEAQLLLTDMESDASAIKSKVEALFATSESEEPAS